jgi:trimeric autotransporter adhesin
MPVFSPDAGTYTSPQNVTISDPTPQATIYYTTDGTPPTASSTVYSGPLAVSTTETINAIATAPDYAASAVASALFTINLPPPSFKISGTAVTVASGATTGNTSSITVTPAGGFTGAVTLTAALTSSPPNAMSPPVLSFGSTSSVNITGSSAATATLTITTTSSTISTFSPPNPRHNGWRTAGGVSLAFVLLFGIPKRSRRWPIVLGLFLALLLVTNGLVACGGGGGHSSQGGQGSPGTTSGAYTITVTGTSGLVTDTGTIALTVN